MFTISMVNMSIFGMNHIKEIKILDSLVKEASWVLELSAKELLDKIKIEYRIND